MESMKDIGALWERDRLLIALLQGDAVLDDRRAFGTVARLRWPRRRDVAVVDDVMRRSAVDRVVHGRACDRIRMCGRCGPGRRRDQRRRGPGRHSESGTTP